MSLTGVPGVETPALHGDEPRVEYLRRLEARQAVARRHERLHIHLGNLRLALAIAALVLGWIALRSALSLWWLAIPVGGFAVLAVFHERVLRALRQARLAAGFYEHGLARIEDRWAGRGASGERFRDDAHPYASDLDLFGNGSLFQLLSLARTPMGEEALARSLLHHAPVGEVRARQGAVAALRPRLDFREDVALLGEEHPGSESTASLVAWAEAPPVLHSPGARRLAVFLAFAAAMALAWTLAALVLFLLDATAVRPDLLPARVLAAVTLVEGVFVLVYRRRVKRVLETVERPARQLARRAAMLARIEREPFEDPLLRALRAELNTEGLPPSAELARLARLTDLLDSRDNLLVRMVGPVLLWNQQCALAIEAWRRRVGPSVGRWIRVMAEIEALNSFAAYAFEHPHDPFPDLIANGPRFEGDGLGHPLLPQRAMVLNDVKLDGDAPLLVVSGSNMSGKSTLLRTVGVNAILAMAGAPVRARRLRLSPLTVGASIRVVDSLQEGTSRFYAEITRIRKIVDLAGGPHPLLFLLDELLHGTNSHDRRIGAEAIVRGLVERGALGLFTTHDLALTESAGALGGRNVHFVDHLENGRISFDYRLRDGVVRKSNALELMRSVGLRV